jgi:hypothetical protein
LTHWEESVLVCCGKLYIYYRQEGGQTGVGMKEVSCLLIYVNTNSTQANNNPDH